MKLWSDSWTNGDAIPARYAAGKIEPGGEVGFSDNLNPHLAWSELPAGTRSLVLICHDFDVPSRGDDVNKERPRGACRPAARGLLPLGDGRHRARPRRRSARASSAAASPRAASPGRPPRHGARQGLNDYTGWFAGDAQMAGDYFGYDGPCPPWNDSLVHHYVFTLYAVTCDRLAVDGAFTGPQVREAMAGKVLAEATLSGTYTLNRRLVRG